MKKKSIISIVMAICLVAVTMVGATLAFFTDKTQEVVNTFTVGNVDIDLTEPDWDPDEGLDLYPGAEIPKDPQITNTGTGDGYIVMKVSGMTEMKDQGFYAFFNEADWDLVNEAGEAVTVTRDAEGNALLVDGYYVYNKGALASGATTPALFEKVNLSEDAKEFAGATYKIMGMFKDADGNLFAYEDAEGNEIAENVGKQPAVFNEDGTPKVFYVVNGDSHAPFDTAEEASEYVRETYKDSASFVFNLTVQGYAIQTTDIVFAEYTTWVPTLVAAK